ncbi:unnamed protein product [Parajaminaea phylloscopi]
MSASTTQPQEDNSKPRDWVPLMSGKTASKYADPCAHAAKASMKCLEDNQYDRTKCTKAFEDYRECKKSWVLQRRSDRQAGREGAWD